MKSTRTNSKNPPKTSAPKPRSGPAKPTAAVARQREAERQLREQDHPRYQPLGARQPARRR